MTETNLCDKFQCVLIIYQAWNVSLICCCLINQPKQPFNFVHSTSEFRKGLFLHFSPDDLQTVKWLGLEFPHLKWLLPFLGRNLVSTDLSIHMVSNTPCLLQGLSFSQPGVLRLATLFLWRLFPQKLTLRDTWVA